MSLICIKISHTYLRGGRPFEVIPYDRLYIANNADLPRLQRLFKYYLSMPLTEEFHRALLCLRPDHYSVEKLTEYPITPSSDTPLHDWLPDYENKTLIIPTYVFTKGDNSALAYLQSRMLNTTYRNLNVVLPCIKFHTPRRVYPMLCVICQNIAQYHANHCTPGQYSCQKNFTPALPPNLEEPAKMKARALEELGGNE